MLPEFIDELNCTNESCLSLINLELLAALLYSYERRSFLSFLLNVSPDCTLFDESVIELKFTFFFSQCSFQLSLKRRFGIRRSSCPWYPGNPYENYSPEPELANLPLLAPPKKALAPPIFCPM